MTERTGELIQKISLACITRRENCVDYETIKKDNSKRLAEFALNYFAGAAAGAEIAGDEELCKHIAGICFLISVRGFGEVRELANPSKKI